MKRKNKKFQKRSSNSLSKLSLFQKTDGKFSKKCPLSVKNAPIIDYKNITLLIDVGSSPEKNFSEDYQSGALSFEIFYKSAKLISNNGYFQNYKHQLKKRKKTIGLAKKEGKKHQATKRRKKKK